MIYSMKRTVSPHDLDYNNIASPSAYLRFMQEAAYCQMYFYPPTLDELRAENKTFIVSRLSMSLYAPLHACEEITVQAWACESKGASFPRCARILRGSEVVAELASVWALVDINTREILRSDSYNASYTCEEPIELDLPSRVRVPRDLELTLAGEYTAAYGDVDVNKHINNTHYPDIICGFLPRLDGRRVIRLAMSYLREAPLGEQIKVYVSRESDGEVWVRTVCHDGQTNVEAHILLDETDEAQN